jgi:hypothetical protein
MVKGISELDTAASNAHTGIMEALTAGQISPEDAFHALSHMVLSYSGKRHEFAIEHMKSVAPYMSQEKWDNLGARSKD